MNPLVRLVVAIGLLFSGWLFGQRGAIAPQVLNAEIARLLRWRAFWEGKDSFRSYIPGKIVEAAVVEFPGEAAVFIAEIGVSIFLGLGESNITRVSIQAMGDDKNSTAIDRYIADYGGKPGFRMNPGTMVSSPNFPTREDSSERNREDLKQRSFKFTLPALTTPETVSSRRAPHDFSQFESVVRDRANQFYEPTCGAGEVVIPYFSPKDPGVYVYADFGKCGSGVLTFRRDVAGTWISSQLMLSKSPNDWSTTITQIRKNQLATIRLPSGRR